MRQFLIHRRNQWKIFSLKIRREKEKWIFFGFPHKTFSGEAFVRKQISKVMLVVFMKAKRKVVLHRRYIFIYIEFVHMCDTLTKNCFCQHNIAAIENIELKLLQNYSLILRYNIIFSII